LTTPSAEILQDLLGDLEQKRKILDRCLILAPEINHFSRRILPNSLIEAYTNYLHPVPPAPPNGFCPPTTAPLEKLPLQVGPHEQIPMIASSPSQIPSSPLAEPVAPPCFDENQFAQLVTDIRSVCYPTFCSFLKSIQCLDSWEKDINPVVMTATLEIVSDTSLIHKASKVLAASPSPSSLALSFVVMAVSLQSVSMFCLISIIDRCPKNFLKLKAKPSPPMSVPTSLHS
jgi:hypothetical protein